ncbi:hypothetical protein [Sporohalobacter salinus]|uniref:hypothetical protein n=1 Tax=Sporohalobacter salinus TaxID=1494606 RepID=UPI00195FC6CE|nr:hypothetical protein [Sporohalobacter salinus]MBM7623131.1 hypothetical protein [Sporohalobacter salinus]
MKKLFILSLVAILCLAIFTGCTPSSQTSDTTQQSQADISKEADSDVNRTEPETKNEDQTQTEPEVEKNKTQNKTEKNQIKPEQTETKDTNEETNKKEQFDPTKLTIEGYVQHLVSSTLGNTTSQGNQVLLDYDYSNEKLVLNLAADGNENYTIDVIREKLFAVSNKLFSKAFTDRQDIDELTIVWNLYLVDKKDNEKGGKACTIEMTRDTFESTNWNKVSTEEFPNKVDDFWIHPALTN